MKRTIAVVLVAVLLVSGFAVGCASEPVDGSGKLATVESDITGFDSLEALGGISVNVSQSGSFKITITTDDNLLQYVDVSRKDSRLVMRLTRKVAPTSMEVTVTMPELLGVKLSGASRVIADGFSSSEDFSAEVRDSSTLEMDGITAGEATFDIGEASLVAGEIAADAVDLVISGASMAVLSGSATDVRIDAWGASVTALRNLEAQNANVLLRLASRAEVNAATTLDAVLTEASTLGYVGDPTGDIARSYTSRVYQIDE